MLLQTPTLNLTEHTTSRYTQKKIKITKPIKRIHGKLTVKSMYYVSGKVKYPVVNQ